MKRVVRVVLPVLLVLPLAASAVEIAEAADVHDKVSIAEFDPLHASVATQSVPTGTPLTTLVLPGSLAGTSSTGERVTVTGVTWEADPSYDPRTPGSYTFAPVIPGNYTSETGQRPPHITVAAGDTAALAGENDPTPAPTHTRTPTGEASAAATRGTPQTRASVEPTIGDGWPPAGVPTPRQTRLTPDLSSATPMIEAGDFAISLTGGSGDPTVGMDYSEAGGLLTILSERPMTITNINPAKPATGGIAVDRDLAATLTFEDVNIRSRTRAAVQVPAGANLSLTVTGSSYLASGSNNAGLQVASDAELDITEQSTGSLTASGGTYAAGIGGGRQGKSGTVNISGGTITAISSSGGAGIGGGRLGEGGTVNISGGTIKATSSSGGAGIGGGSSASGGIINIAGGTVTAVSNSYGAGIGGGDKGGGGTISIEDGAVDASSGKYGAGIGGGYQGGVGSIAITGGQVEATSRMRGAGIGGGYSGEGGTIRLTGNAVVIAKGGDGVRDTDTVGYGGGAGIGGGGNGGGLHHITIDNGVVLTATGGAGAKANRDGRDYWPTDASGYGGGGAAIGGGGGNATSAGNPPAAVASPGGTMATVAKLPTCLSGLTLVPGRGAQNGAQTMGGSGGRVGGGGQAYVGPVTGDGGADGVEGTSTMVQLDVPDAGIDHIRELLTGLEPDSAYRFQDNPPVTVPTSTYRIAAEWFGTTITITRAGDDSTTVDSPEQCLSVGVKPVAPNVTTVDETLRGLNDGQLVGVNDAMEYRARNNSVWTAVPTKATTIANLAPGEYQVRLKAVASISFSSRITTVTINPGLTGYTLTVINGTDATGTGRHAANTQVRITADTSDGKQFDHWSSNNGGTFADPNQASTVFTMPAVDVIVTAHYKVDAAISPVSATFDKNPAGADHASISTTLFPGSYTLAEIRNRTALRADIDYTHDANQYTITRQYLASLATGPHTLVFDMTGGTDPTFTITILDTTTATEKPAVVGPGRLPNTGSDNTALWAALGLVYTLWGIRLLKKRGSGR